jgi:hypothetical protein
MGQGMHECVRVYDGHCRNKRRSLRLRHHPLGYFLVGFQLRDLKVGHKRPMRIVSNKPSCSRKSGWMEISSGHSIGGGFILIH